MAYESILPIDLATSGASYTITEAEMNTLGIQRYRIYGTRAGFQLTTSGTMYENNTVQVVWNGTPTGVVDILGTTMPANLQAKDCLIEAVYNGSSWDVFFDVSADQAGFIVDADVAANAAIQRSKLATGTADHVVINSGTGAFSSEARLATTRGGTAIDTSASTGLAKVAAGTWSVATLVNADVAAGAAISYSKLATLNTGQIVAGNAGVPTAVTMSGDATISATGVVTIPNLLWELGSGGTNAIMSFNAVDCSANNSIAAGLNADVSGSGTTGIGQDVTVSASGASVVAYNTTVSGVGHAVIGANNTISGNYNTCAGSGQTNSADYSTTLGAGAENRIDKTTNIAGPIIIRKSDALSLTDPVLYMSGTEVIIMSKVIDLESLASEVITLPTGIKFFCDEVGVIATTISALVTQPTISWGDTGDHAKFVAAAITTTLTATGARQKRTTILDASGVTSLAAEVTVVAAGTTVQGRYYWKGFIVEDQ